ncbi:MAG: SufD family Fe-S cluster assembly protein, partial [Pseudomonadota bacterium]
QLPQSLREALVNELEEYLANLPEDADPEMVAGYVIEQLEIFADDVKCAHGATVGQLDEAARFYMAARGLSPADTQRLLVQAFIGDAFVELDDEESRDKLLGAALGALEGASL